IYAEGSDLLNRLPHVFSVQSARKKNRNRYGFANPNAYRPIMHAPGSAKLLDCRFGSSGVEQNRVHMRCDGFSFLQIFRPFDVDYLYEADARHGVAKGTQLMNRERVHDL